MTATRLIARPLLASTFVVGGVAALKNAPDLAIKAKPVVDQIRPTLEKLAPQVKIPDDTVTLVRVNAVAQILAAVALARGRAPRLSSTVLAASLLPTTVAGHQFWNEDRPGGEGQPEDPLLQEPLHARRADPGLGRHRGSPGRRLEGEERRLRHPARGQAPGQAGQARGSTRREVARPITSGRGDAPSRTTRPVARAGGARSGRRARRAPRFEVADQPRARAGGTRRRPLRRTTGAAVARHRADGGGTDDARLHGRHLRSRLVGDPGSAPRRCRRLRPGRHRDALRPAGGRPRDRHRQLRRRPARPHPSDVGSARRPAWARRRDRRRRPGHAALHGGGHRSRTRWVGRHRRVRVQPVRLRAAARRGGVRRGRERPPRGTTGAVAPPHRDDRRVPARARCRGRVG